MMKANANKNKGCVPHRHKVRDKAFVLHDKISYVRERKLSDPQEGPCLIIEVFKHGNAVRINHNRMKEIFPIARIKPHFRYNINTFKSMRDNEDAHKTACHWKLSILESEKVAKLSKHLS